MAGKGLLWSSWRIILKIIRNYSITNLYCNAHYYRYNERLKNSPGNRRRMVGGMIKAFLIDLFDTLVHIDEELYGGWRFEMAGRLKVPEKELLDFWWSRTSDRFLGRIKSTADMLHLVAAHFGTAYDDETVAYCERRELEELYRHSHLYPGTREVLAEIKKSGYLTALVSNASYNGAPLLSHLGLTELFDESVISCLVGMAKPEEGIYRLALTRLGVNPSEAMFIGDGACQELDGAHALGICTVRIVQTPQTELFGKSSKYHHTVASLSESLALARELDGRGA